MLAVEDMGLEGGVSAETLPPPDDNANDTDGLDGPPTALGEPLCWSKRRSCSAARLACAAVVEAGALDTRLNVRPVVAVGPGDVAGDA